MDTHANTPEAPERSHPLVWTVGLFFIIITLVAWFTHFYQFGEAEGREEGMIPATSATPKGPGEPDHLALIKNKSADVLDRGATLFGKNCASCHGPQGNTNPTSMNPPPRNFWTDAFKNPNGGGPHGIYLVLTNGFAGRMPSFSATLSAEDRYALAHYVLETFVKPNNPNYQKELQNNLNDSKELLAKVPATGSGSGAEPIAPKEQPVPKEVFPLMHGVAETSTGESVAASVWLKRAIEGSEGSVRVALEALDRRWVGDKSAGTRTVATASLVVLSRTITTGTPEAIREMLLNPAPGAFVPEIGLLSVSDLDMLIAQLRKVAPVTKPVAGVN